MNLLKILVLLLPILNLSQNNLNNSWSPQPTYSHQVVPMLISSTQIHIAFCDQTDKPTGATEQTGFPLPTLLAARGNQQEHIFMTELRKGVCVALDKLFTSF